MTQILPPRPKSKIRPRRRAKRCFELAARYQMDDPTWTLVHGSLVMPDLAVRYAHAWLKRDGWVYDAVEDETFAAAVYAERFGALEVATFTPAQVAQMLSKHGPFWRAWVTYDATVIGW